MVNHAYFKLQDSKIDSVENNGKFTQNIYRSREVMSRSILLGEHKLSMGAKL